MERRGRHQGVAGQRRGSSATSSTQLRGEQRGTRDAGHIAEERVVVTVLEENGDPVTTLPRWRAARVCAGTEYWLPYFSTSESIQK